MCVLFGSGNEQQWLFREVKKSVNANIQITRGADNALLGFLILCFTESMVSRLTTSAGLLA